MCLVTNHWRWQMNQNRCVKFKVQIPKSTKSETAQATPAASLPTALIIDVVGDDVIDVRD